ncbi:hypothetical protein NSS91_16150 [Caldifermentibacillus hisashii]|uniref:hypothetical protein n=1 Tax=Caldifermentibacillus hisashii TaxID=996558 RepID=UPI0031FCE973
MTDKERLEEIKERFVKYEYDYNLNGEDIEWLIEQAERVQDLKIMLKVLGRQTERFKKALEFYADESNYREHDLKGIVPPRPIAYKPILHDYGSIARQALEGDEN